MSISKTAAKYIGEKEKPSNTGFVNKDLEDKIKAVGWQPGWAWCAAFIEAVFAETYPERAKEVSSLFVPSAVNTFRNLKNAGYKATMQPEVDAFVFWQRMKDGVAQWQGHTGIVSQILSIDKFKSIEGNTNGIGSREGDGVYEKVRTVNTNVENGLKIIGFIKL